MNRIDRAQAAIYPAVVIAVCRAPVCGDCELLNCGEVKDLMLEDWVEGCGVRTQLFV